MAKKKVKATSKPKTKAKKAAKKAKKAAKPASVPKREAKAASVKKAAKKARNAPGTGTPAATKVAPAAPLVLAPSGLIGGLLREDSTAPVEGATWYTAKSEGGGIEYRFPAGSLAGMKFLAADMLLDGRLLGVFSVALQEGDGGAKFVLTYALLPQCSARMRARLEGVNQNRWRFDREGAWLKPLCGGDIVDLRKVDRMTISVVRKGDDAVRWCMTDIAAHVDEPPLLEQLVLPKGALVDELGQAATHTWKGRSRSTLEVTARLESQHATCGWQHWPESWSRWGGCSTKLFDATGFFRTHHDGNRWWLVDPEGSAFWSAGMDCVRVDTNAAYSGLEEALMWLPDPDGEFADAHQQREGSAATFNYLAANFIRAFTSEKWYEAWSMIALAHLKKFGFNTVANWSDWQIAKAAGFPYVRPLQQAALERLPMVFRDFPDVFSPAFDPAATAFAEQLTDTVDDQAFIGYFLMNEPTWGFAAVTPAAGMLMNSTESETRKALASFLEERHGTDKGLSDAWQIKTTFAAVGSGAWSAALTPSAKEDLAAFSEVMVEKLFKTLSAACKEVDVNHLNLGARYFTVPPQWAVKGMKYFDVFSMNCYRDRVPADEMSQIAALLECPVMIGEWHFGAHDVGLPASGIGRVRDQQARGAAFKFYTEDAAAKPECVGVHYFTLYDQSVIGRFDGECYNIGFLDVCNRPYEELASAAREAHERLYQIAAGELEPTPEQPEYLPKLFL